MTQIAFIGLGHMGLPMARNLLKAGFAVTAFDLAQEALDAFARRVQQYGFHFGAANIYSKM